MKPIFSKYRVAELCICAVALLVGCLYLWTHILPLGVVLPILFVCFAIVPICRFLEGRANGLSGIALWLPVLVMGLVADIVLVAWITYLAG